MNVIVWKCDKCGDVVVSHAREHHNMNSCKCGESFMDLEKWGCRQTQLTILKLLNDDEYPINLEMLMNYRLQINEYECLKDKELLRIEFMMYGKNLVYIPKVRRNQLDKIRDNICKQLARRK